MQYNACVDKNELSGSGEKLRGWGWLVGGWVGWGVRQTAAGGGREQEGTEGGTVAGRVGGVSDGAVTRRTSSEFHKQASDNLYVLTVSQLKVRRGVSLQKLAV